MKKKRIIYFGLTLLFLMGSFCYILVSGFTQTDAAIPTSNVLTVNNTIVKNTFTNQMLGVNLVNWEHSWGKPYPNAVPGLAQALKAAHVGLIRYGGGNWSNTIGWNRTTANAPFTGWPDANNGPYWFQYNPQEIDSLAQLAKTAGADVLIEVNVTDNNPNMWADMIKYTNVEHNYGFKYWELGNELDILSGGPSAAEYSSRIGQYIDKMTAVDPSIKITISGAASPYQGFNEPSTPLSDYLTQPYKVVSPNGKKAQALSYHWYQACNSGTADDLTRYAYDGLETSSWRNNYSRKEADLMPHRIINELTQDTIPQGVTEFNFDACNFDNPMNGNFMNALWTTDVLGRMAYNGTDFATRWEGYGTQAYAFLSPDNGDNPTRLNAVPAYYAYLMYANYFGNQVIESSTNDNDRLSIWASRDSANPSQLKLMITNMSGSNITSPVNLTGFTAGSANLYQMRSANPTNSAVSSLSAAVTINGTSVDIMNVAQSVAAIKPVPLAVSGSSFSYTFPAYSTTAIVLNSGTAPTTTTVAATTTPVKTTTVAATTTPNPTTTTATPKPTTTTPKPTTTTPNPTTTAPGGQNVTTTASVSTSSVVRGQAVSITTNVKAGSTAATMLVDTEVYCSADNVNWTKDFQSFRDNQAFTAGQTRTFTDSWTVPASHAVASCMVKVGLFTPGWATNLAFNDTVPFNIVQAPATTTTPVPTTTTPPASTTITATVSLSKTSVVKGQPISITTKVKAGNTATKLLVDTEVYCTTDNVNWTKDYQNFRDNQSYTAGQTRSYTDKWTVSANHAAATCVVKVGLFTPGWAKQINFFDTVTFTIS